MSNQLEKLAAILAGWQVDIDLLKASLSDVELASVASLAAERYLNGSNDTRTEAQVYKNAMDGKLCEYALIRKLERFNAIQNNEAVTKEIYWDLQITLDQIPLKLEVKRQLRRSESINFTQAQSHNTMCQNWQRINGIVIMTAMGNTMQPWCVLSPEVLDPNRGFIAKLDFRPSGFCLPIKPIVAAGLGVEVDL